MLLGNTLSPWQHASSSQQDNKKMEPNRSGMEGIYRNFILILFKNSFCLNYDVID